MLMLICTSLSDFSWDTAFVLLLVDFILSSLGAAPSLFLDLVKAVFVVVLVEDFVLSFELAGEFF